MKTLYCILFLFLLNGPAHAQSEEYTDSSVTNEFEVSMDENGTYVLDAGKQKVDFGKVKVGERKEKTATIKNKTNAILYPAIYSINGDNGFSVQIYTFGVPPGATTTAKFSYTGISTEPFGDHKATAVIVLKDKGVTPVVFNYDIKGKLVKP